MAENESTQTSNETPPLPPRLLLRAGIALPWPNADPNAIPEPDSIAFTYSLHRPPLCEIPEHDRKCSLCLKSFATGIPEGDSYQIMGYTLEVPLRLPCCGRICGDQCLREKWLSEITGLNKHSCRFCHYEFFAKPAEIGTEEWKERVRRYIGWVTQETQRVITEGPKEWREAAREKLKQWEQVTTADKLNQYFAEKQATFRRISVRRESERRERMQRERERRQRERSERLRNPPTLRVAVINALERVERELSQAEPRRDIGSMALDEARMIASFRLGVPAYPRPEAETCDGCIVLRGFDEHRAEVAWLLSQLRSHRSDPDVETITPQSSNQEGSQQNGKET